MINEDLMPTEDDVGKTVKFEIDRGEVEYLQKLLGCEIVYQVRAALIREDEDAEKVVKILSIFDYYRTLDDQLLDLMFILDKTHKDIAKTGLQAKSSIVVDKSIAKIYRVLCQETVKAILPEDVAVLKEMYNDILLNKIKTALDNPVTENEVELNKETKKISVNKKDKDLAGINIYKKGLA